jgi:hypothetical protein
MARCKPQPAASRRVPQDVRLGPLAEGDDGRIDLLASRDTQAGIGSRRTVAEEKLATAVNDFHHPGGSSAHFEAGRAEVIGVIDPDEHGLPSYTSALGFGLWALGSDSSNQG